MSLKIFSFLLLFFFSPHALISYSSKAMTLERRFGPSVLYNVCGQVMNLYIADTNEKKRLGFMNLSEPKKNKGILFVFPKEKVLSFWMKNVPFNLDIFYFSQDKALVSKSEMLATSPLEIDSSLPSYSSSSKAMYAIETQVGALKKRQNCKFYKVDQK